MDQTRLPQVINLVRLMRVVLLAAITLAIPLTLSAQEKSGGTVSGVVKDSTGAVVSDAEVSINNSQQVVLSKTRTDTSGKFKFSGIPPGSYVVMVGRPDFSYQREAVQVPSGGTSELIIFLQLNQLSEHVTVTSEAGLVSAANSVAQPINIITEDKVIERATEVVAQVVE
ncbi:MAG TPA: carboxypeptidase-like regulatory domain-containing protein, partial [Pyrinomonadaceae bacterium]|nr:carboxypeptidase-like regulatory domain-containing protein [Pyrinomonadaceae bacterium]